MGLIGWIADQREKVILGNARTYLDNDEDVLDWVRARHPSGKEEGFIFATEKRVIVHWTGKSDGNDTVLWGDIECWGLDAQAVGGPVLIVQDAEASAVAQMPVETEGAAERVSGFLKRFARMAPHPNKPLRESDVHPGRWVTDADVQLVRQKKSVSAITKRVVATVVGTAMVVGGIAITWLPGPWSFPIVLAGLAILSTEYDWAKDALAWSRKKYQQAATRLKKQRASTEE